MPFLHVALLATVLTLPRHAVFGAALADKPAGVTVTRVIPNSAAASAGLLAGDVIQRLAGVSTPDIAAFLSEMHALHAGEHVTVVVTRDGRPLDLTADLGTPANETDSDVTTVYGAVEVDGTLRRTLTTIPKGNASRRPAVLFIGGIGCFSIDVASDPQDPYLRLAHDLSRRGFVTMRLEKSGVGDSQGPPCATVDLSNEEHSYEVALAALLKDPSVDAKHVYLFGHSIGTVMAPRLAETGSVAGIVVAEAVGRDWFEYEMRNTRRQLDLGGASPAETDAAMIGKYVCMYRLLVQKESEPAIEADRADCKEHNRVYPVDPRYVQQAAALNIIEAWTKVDAPVLAVYGSSDFVTELDDHERIVAVVNAHHQASGSFHEIDGMDHLLFRAATPKDALVAFQKGAPREYDSDLSETVLNWLCSRERCKQS
jgi:pimeloyl-ACP methyl ester carboxylesterase